jgi:hypothetical protein
MFTPAATMTLERRARIKIKPKENLPMRLILLILALLLSPGVAGAQSLEEIDKRQAALIEAWQKTPLTIRKALFVKDQPRGYGIYEEHPSKEFKPGEKVIVYAEPVGHGWKDLGNGLFQLGFVVDFVIKSKDGELLAGKDNFMRIAAETHTRNLEFMVVLTLNMSSAPAGDYVIEYKLHDIASDKTASFRMPFKIAS